MSIDYARELADEAAKLLSEARPNAVGTEDDLVVARAYASLAAAEAVIALVEKLDGTDLSGLTQSMDNLSGMLDGLMSGPRLL